MATVNTAIQALLTADPTIAAIVVDRIHHRRIPQGGVVPAVTYREHGTTEVQSSSGRGGLVNCKMRVCCYAADLATVESLKNAVLDCLADYSGTSAAVVVREATFESEDDTDDSPAAGTDQVRLGKAIEFSVWYER